MCFSISGIAADTNLNRAAQAEIETKEVGKGYRLSLGQRGFEAALQPPERSVRTASFAKGTPLHLRINAGMEMGGPDWRYMDDDGKKWLPDRRWSGEAQWGVEGGRAWFWSEKDLLLPKDQSNPGLYRAAHFDPRIYRFRLPGGSYRLKLHFQENADPAEVGEGDRVFDVTINGRTVLTGFDVRAAAGADREPIVKTFEAVTIDDGMISIGFEPRTEKSPFINAIEIIGEEPLAEDFSFETGELWMSQKVPAISPCPGEVVGRFLCGVADRAVAGYQLETDGGMVWMPDGPASAEIAGFWARGGGAGRVHAGIQFLNTSNPQIYRHQRFGGDGYEIAVPEAGKYGVRLHFVEGSEVNSTTRQRIFQVLAEEEMVLEKVHPMVDGGGFGMPAVFEVRGIDVSDGHLSLGYNNLQHHSAISAIELFRDPEGPDRPVGKQIAGPTSRENLKPVNERTPLRVLYVGNSHTFFWDMPGTVAASVATLPGSEIQLDPYAYLHGGRILDFFSTSAKIDKRPSVFDVMQAGRYDAVNLQIFSVRKSEAVEKMLEGLAEFAEVARTAGTAIMLYCFHPLDILEREAKNRFEALVREHAITVIPFGDVHRHLNDQLADSDLDFDLKGVGVHLGFHPAYLNACLHTIAWTGQNPTGHPFPTLLVQDSWVTGEQARFIQECAWAGWLEARQKYDLRTYPENNAHATAGSEGEPSALLNSAHR